jgi:hypothetical protein
MRRILPISGPVLAVGLAGMPSRTCLAGRVIVQWIGYRGEERTSGRPNVEWRLARA